MAQPSEESSRPESPLHCQEKSLHCQEERSSSPEEPSHSPEKPLQSPEKPLQSSETPLQFSEEPLQSSEKSIRERPPHSQSRLTETHFYDGQLEKAVLEADLSRASQKTSEEKLAAFGLLRSLLPKITHHNFDVIVRDFIRTGRTKGANYDPTNDLYADDLLYLCSELSSDPVLIDLLTAQLVDMSTGICPQGRTHRLFQVLWALQ